MPEGNTANLDLGLRRRGESMRTLVTLAIICMTVQSVHAEERFIVRATTRLLLNTACSLLGCTVGQGLGDPTNQLFLVTTPDGVVANVFMTSLSALLGI